MMGDAIGVMVVLLLGGLMLPILLLLAAAVFDVVVVGWALFRSWHDDLWPAIARSARRTVHLPGVRLTPR
ncbi:MAG TPA: hypothetical protein VGD77_08935 [Gemmatimonadaceae bacterium]